MPSIQTDPTPSVTTLTWTFPEYPRLERSQNWFIGWGIVGAVLFLYGIFTGNFLFAGIVVFVAAIYALQHYRHPLNVTFAISQDSIRTDNHSIPWKDIKNFWILYEPPEVKNLYFEFKGWRPRLKVPLQDQNPLEVRAALIPYIDEDLEKEQEPFSDAVGRLFKL